MRYLAYLTLITAAMQGQALSLELGMGTRYTSFSYAEQVTPPNKSTESVIYPAYLVELSLDLVRGSRLQLQHEFIKDLNSKYSGSDLNTSAPVTATNLVSFYNYEALLFLPITQRLTIYGGMGNHKWDRFLAGTPGYREVYNWNYQPTGAQIWLIQKNNYRLGLDVSARKTNAGKIKVITSQTTAGGADSEMNLGARTGYRAALPIIWRLGRMSISTTPFFELSQIGASEVVANATLSPTPGTGIMEPSSNTHRYGLELLLILPL